MIGLLRGTVIETEGNLALIDVNGVGYEVSVSDVALSKLVLKQEVTLFIRQIIREDANFLCGFLDRSERRIFDLLLGVQGCGPKVAQALLGQVGAEKIVSAIVSQNPKPLTAATGVGAKLGERLILELRNKIGHETISVGGLPFAAPANSPDRDLVDALTALGYRRPEIDTILPKLDPNEATDLRLKQALQLLKKPN
jgi:holliday junction DNA helicase RuvA